MSKTRADAWFHVMALATILAWGVTFVSTKVLLDHGLTPAEIMLYRFLIAYLLILVPTFRRPRATLRHPRARSLRDELLFLALGVSGGSLYFLAENVALEYTLTSNVAVLVCTAPLFTLLLSRIFLKDERPATGAWRGSLVAMAGVVLVVFNGNFVLRVEPVGDLLAILAAVSWGFYTIILRELDRRYDILFITRKVFFYGLLTLLPVFFFAPPRLDASLLLSPTVAWNLLFLGVIASFICYVLWNRAIRQLGAVRVSNYIYLNPVVTLVTSAIVLSERVTPLAITGMFLILGGVYLIEKRATGAITRA
ncbi:MAG: DMT family transporter [Odoribacteraceae bacterium]|jgi:drug/metabolite transporter (DMT)-like permease|nr:DMT family transporter [Odoribacteraceae bacterium]